MHFVENRNKGIAPINKKPLFIYVKKRCRALNILDYFWNILVNFSQIISGHARTYINVEGLIEGATRVKLEGRGDIFPANFDPRQGEQIGRIFAVLAIVHFRQLILKLCTEVGQIFGNFFPRKKLCIN
jgi:hypothetical protein